MKRFELLKDIPGAKAGVVFEETKNGYVHRINGDQWIGLPKFIFNENPEWFKEITLCKHQVFCVRCHMEISINDH